MAAEKTIQRQITFSSELYARIGDEADSENSRLGKIMRKEKIHIQDIIPTLVQDGLNHRKGFIYTPADLELAMSKDEKWVKLKAKAENALADFIKYQQEFLVAEK